MKDTKKGDFTTGPITKNILLFALPLMCGNLLQQMYNIADTWVVGRFLGADALAAVGSSYTLMVFLTSILLGLCMGSGAAISMDYGSGQTDRMRRDVFLSFALIAALSTFLNVLVYVFIDPILDLLCVPADVVPLMKTYLLIIFAGIFATFLYNYYASILRAIGNSVVPLIFLAVAVLLNVALDLLFVIVLRLGVGGAAFATVIAQFVSGIGLLFLLYGYYRAVDKPLMSVILTVASLGTRVALAYALAPLPAVGVIGIWWSVPIGWGLADLAGLLYYKAKKQELLF